MSATRSHRKDLACADHDKARVSAAGPVGRYPAGVTGRVESGDITLMSEATHRAMLEDWLSYYDTENKSYNSAAVEAEVRFDA